MPDISHPYHHVERSQSGNIVNIRTLPIHEGAPGTMQRQYRAVQTDCPDSPIHQFTRSPQQESAPVHPHALPPQHPHYSGVDAHSMPPGPPQQQQGTLGRRTLGRDSSLEGYVHQPACQIGASTEPTFSQDSMCYPPHTAEPTYMNIQTYTRSPGEHPSRHLGESHIGGDWMIHTKIWSSLFIFWHCFADLEREQVADWNPRWLSPYRGKSVVFSLLSVFVSWVSVLFVVFLIWRRVSTQSFFLRKSAMPLF